MTREKSKYCRCCNKLLSWRQRDRHYATKLSEQERETRERSVSPCDVDDSEHSNQSVQEGSSGDTASGSNLELDGLDNTLQKHDTHSIAGKNTDEDAHEDTDEDAHEDADEDAHDDTDKDADIIGGGNEMDISPIQSEFDTDSSTGPGISLVEDDWLSYREDEELDAEEEYALFEKILDSE